MPQMKLAEREKGRDKIEDIKRNHPLSDDAKKNHMERSKRQGKKKEGRGGGGNEERERERETLWGESKG